MYIHKLKTKSPPATVESSILLLWVKGDSVEAEAISCPPIALLSKPSISVKEKRTMLSLIRILCQEQPPQYSFLPQTAIRFICSKYVAICYQNITIFVLFPQYSFLSLLEHSSIRLLRIFFLFENQR